MSTISFSVFLHLWPVWTSPGQLLLVCLTEWLSVWPNYSTFQYLLDWNSETAKVFVPRVLEQTTCAENYGRQKYVPANCLQSRILFVPIRFTCTYFFWAYLCICVSDRERCRRKNRSKCMKQNFSGNIRFPLHFWQFYQNPIDFFFFWFVFDVAYSFFWITNSAHWWICSLWRRTITPSQFGQLFARLPGLRSDIRVTISSHLLDCHNGFWSYIATNAELFIRSGKMQRIFWEWILGSDQISEKGTWNNSFPLSRAWYKIQASLVTRITFSFRLVDYTNSNGAFRMVHSQTEVIF